MELNGKYKKRSFFQYEGGESENRYHEDKGINTVTII